MLYWIYFIDMTSHYHGQTSHNHSTAACGSKQQFDHDNVTLFLCYKSNIT